MEQPKYKLAIGILAHVDAGKTTLSEGMLYKSGALRKLGRVDHQDAFLDTDHLERERGITIFSKQAVLPLGELEVTLLDTPGHVDFSAEMERTLQVLDYAILVVSGADGVQGHTRTLWELLHRYQIPTFLFINKMDQPGTDAAALTGELQQLLGEGCVPFAGLAPEEFQEAVALRDEGAMEEYLEKGEVSPARLRELIRRRRLFPCYFGSALRLEGVDALLEGLRQYTLLPAYPAEFGAKVYKIARDPQGVRLTYLKVTGGSLRVKAVVAGQGGWEEKVDQIRIYSGARFRTVEEAPAGTVCAVTGLSHTYPGEGLGAEPSSPPPSLASVLNYQLLLPSGCDPHSTFLQLQQLEEEDPQLKLVWDERLQEIHLRPMGEVQLEVLQRMIQERFGLKVSFGEGSILYLETIQAPVEGVGHFEPLRHYAEVHLLLEPGPRGSGLRFATWCSEEQLDRNWQRLILTHLAEKTHLGVLTGSPITDMRITLVAGRAHLKHTEGGDFRQATYRAVRQGLMLAQSILLEPYYAFRLEVPTPAVGRAMGDLQRMGAQFGPPEAAGDRSVLSGSAPVATMRGYARQVASYTQGQGKLFCTLQGYAPCHNQQQVVEAAGYDCQRDLENTGDSVFCDHGAGMVVKWDQVRQHMHVDSGLGPDGRPAARQAASPAPAAPAGSGYRGSLEEDRELRAIYERTYGPVRDRGFLSAPTPRQEALQEEPDWESLGEEFLLVDGYNILFAWEELKKLAQESMDAARQALMDLLCNYQGYKKCVVILVFDAYKVPRSVSDVLRYHNIYVVYTKQAETADAYIEKVTYEIGKRHHVRVATSDNLEQVIILGHGAFRLSAWAFHAEMEQVNGQIAQMIAEHNRKSPKLNQLKLEGQG
ncbi:MAG TPA: TetM/TetW/TetO/TetS family tetracycline resistance ribosomal protection protein [Candidatus Anaerotruncus excrementipullorum]|uniref:TetM/TetW/TetO/TetS family tetracycline resistance ribosomal protection protein n=1 Tax=Candidatus Anaerotruncus excrementipullorum TaxID=2838465 RepID=A0A9D2B7J5_9FIRM|nr:TetM/TetW/TetO/TetS family tetracycline resistance ribosomal protection protein [Candidatus Anaerotruncus excrementipullorum]